MTRRPVGLVGAWRSVRRKPVFGPDPPAMSLDDLAGDRQAEARVLSEPLFRPIGVEALENPLQRMRRYARPIVLDRNFDALAFLLGALTTHCHTDLATGRRERPRVVDEVDH